MEATGQAIAEETDRSTGTVGLRRRVETILAGTGQGGDRPAERLIESFSGRIRVVFLNGTRFGSLFEAAVLTQAWRIDCNTRRPDSAHCWLTPAGFAGR